MHKPEVKKNYQFYECASGDYMVTERENNPDNERVSHEPQSSRIFRYAPETGISIKINPEVRTSDRSCSRKWGSIHCLLLHDRRYHAVGGIKFSTAPDFHRRVFSFPLAIQRSSL